MYVALAYSHVPQGDGVTALHAASDGRVPRSAASKAVTAHVAFFSQTEMRSADDHFRQSAIATARALDHGVSAVELARLYSRATVHLKAARSMPTYTSDVAVGYHARTGRLLLKPLPPAPATAREVQTLVKVTCASCGTRAVDRALRRARSQSEAYAGLQAELERQRTWRLEEQGAERRAEEAHAFEPGEVDEDLLTLLDEAEALLASGAASWAAVNRLSELAGRAAALLSDQEQPRTAREDVTA